MSETILSQNPQQSTQPNNQQQQAQQLMRDYLDMPIELQKLYSGIAQHIAIVAYGDNQDRVISDDK